MVFSNDKKVNGKSFKFHFDNILLKRVFNFNYLGIILNYNLNDSLDIERSTGSFNRSFGFLSFYRSFGFLFYVYRNTL